MQRFAEKPSSRPKPGAPTTPNPTPRASIGSRADASHHTPTQHRPDSASSPSRFGTRAHLSEVTRVVLVHHDPVVVLATGVTATGGVLAVLADAAVTGGHVAALLTVLVQLSRREWRVTRGRASEGRPGQHAIATRSRASRASPRPRAVAGKRRNP